VTPPPSPLPFVFLRRVTFIRFERKDLLGKGGFLHLFSAFPPSLRPCSVVPSRRHGVYTPARVGCLHCAACLIWAVRRVWSLAGPVSPPYAPLTFPACCLLNLLPSCAFLPLSCTLPFPVYTHLSCTPHVCFVAATFVCFWGISGAYSLIL
jgi:hypothetical protein